jgi:preprotein translocase subunit SecF
MLTCGKKLFNKFLLVSIFFLIFSIVSSVFLASATQTVVKRTPNVNSKQIQVQQRKIIYHLEKLEKQLVSKRNARK